MLLNGPLSPPEIGALDPDQIIRPRRKYETSAPRIAWSSLLQISGWGIGIALQEIATRWSLAIGGSVTLAGLLVGFWPVLSVSARRRVLKAYVVAVLLAVGAATAISLRPASQADQPATKADIAQLIEGLNKAAEKLTDERLSVGAIELAKKMRGFEASYRVKEDSIVRDDGFGDRYAELHNAEELEFRNIFQGEARFYLDELRRRLHHPLSRPPIEFDGYLAGASPIHDAASYLEKLARELSPSIATTPDQ